MAVWPVGKLREIFQSIDQQLKDSRSRMDRLEQAAAQRVVRLEEALNEERRRSRMLEDQLQNETEKLRRLREKVETDSIKLHKEQEQGAKAVAALEKKQQEMQERERQSHQAWQRMQEDEAQWRRQATSDAWYEKFGYDGLFANLQLAVVEQIVPGNRARLEAMRDTHQGETCFVVANGPSLTADDLSVLHRHNVFSFGSKRINKIYPETDWRPDIWAASDLNYIEKYYGEISAMREVPLMLPCQALLNLNLPPIANAVYYPFLQVGQRRDAWFNYDVTKGVHFWGTITVKLINFAVYMGFTKIYLLGADNNYPTIKNAGGKTVLDETKKTHFSDDYNTPEERRKLEEETEDLSEAFRYITKGFQTAKYFCDQKEIEIYNATRGGALEVFPRVDFDTLFDGN